MNKPGLLAVLSVIAPLCAAAPQEPAPPAPPPDCGGADDTWRASGALPARASVAPAPHLGSVAPANRVLSHTETPSMRAMRAAREKEAAREGGRAPEAQSQSGTPCVPKTGPQDGKQR